MTKCPFLHILFAFSSVSSCAMHCKVKWPLCYQVSIFSAHRATFHAANAATAHSLQLFQLLSFTDCRSEVHLTCPAVVEPGTSQLPAHQQDESTIHLQHCSRCTTQVAVECLGLVVEQACHCCSPQESGSADHKLRDVRLQVSIDCICRPRQWLQRLSQERGTHSLGMSLPEYAGVAAAAALGCMYAAMTAP